MVWNYNWDVLLHSLVHSAMVVCSDLIFFNCFCCYRILLNVFWIINTWQSGMSFKSEFYSLISSWKNSFEQAIQFRGKRQIIFIPSDYECYFIDGFCLYNMLKTFVIVEPHRVIWFLFQSPRCLSRRRRNRTTLTTRAVVTNVWSAVISPQRFDVDSL